MTRSTASAIDDLAAAALAAVREQYPDAREETVAAQAVLYLQRAAHQVKDRAFCRKTPMGSIRETAREVAGG